MYMQMRGHKVHLEPQFYVYSVKGELLATSKRNGRMAQQTLELPYTGNFHVFAHDKGGNDADLFGFSLHALNRMECFPEVGCGDTESTEVSSLAARLPYKLSMKAGETGILQMRSSNPSLEISFEIFDETGKMKITETGSDKMVGTLMFSEEDAEYLIVVQDKHGNDYGQIGMHFETILGNGCAEELVCERENKFEHELYSLAQLRSYMISGVENEPWSFSMTDLAGPVEPYLRLYGPDGTMVAEHFASTKAKLEGVFSENGTYLLLAGDKSGNDTGQYLLESYSSRNTVMLPDTVYLKEGDCMDLLPSVNARVKSYHWSTGDDTDYITICGGSAQRLLGLTCVFENGCSAYAETFVQVEKTPCQIIDFNEFTSGEIMEDQLQIVKISVKSDKKGTDVACIFPSGDPPSYDADLGTPHEDYGGPGKGKGGKKGEKGENNTAQDKVLIIAENTVDRDRDGYIDQPNDEANGGRIYFEFTREVEIKSLKVIDVENEGSKIELWGLTNKKLETIPLGPLGDNSVYTIDINTSGVHRMEIKFKGSGAIDDIVYCPAPIPATLTRDGRDHVLPASLHDVAVQNNENNRESTTTKAYDVQIFPNPNQGFFNIDLPGTMQNAVEISVYNSLGQKVYHNAVPGVSMEQRVPIQLSNQPTGLYLVEIKSGSNRVVRKVQLF